MLKSLNTYWQFLKHPYLLRLNKPNTKQFRFDFISILILDLIFLSLIVLIYSCLLNLNWIKEYESLDLIKEYGIKGALFIACVLAPISEEIIFRLHLRMRNLNIYFVFLSISIISAYFFINDPIKWSIYLFFLIFAVIFHYGFSKKSIGRSQKLWAKCYPFIFYFTAVIFGLVHLGNFEHLTISDPSFILYISSQIFGGLGLGYIRIKYGLMYSIFQHSCYNAIIILIELVFIDR